MLSNRLRLMSLGRPKAGKTGLVAPALAAGFRVAVLSFDNNPEPLHLYGGKDTASRLSVIPLRDKLYRRANGTFSALGKENQRVEPQAYLRAGRALDNWGDVAKDHPWGPVPSWGPDTILMLDSLTGLGDAANNIALFINNRDEFNKRRSDWAAAMKAEDSFLEMLVSPDIHCHLYATAHMRLIGPQTQDDGKDDDDDLKNAKHAIAAAQAEVLPTRFYPTALGRALPQEILRRIPASILVESTDAGRHVHTRPPRGIPIDIGVPGMLGGKALAPTLSHGTAFLDIMEAVCGYRTPPQVAS